MVVKMELKDSANMHASATHSTQFFSSHILFHDLYAAWV